MDVFDYQGIYYICTVLRLIVIFDYTISSGNPQLLFFLTTKGAVQKEKGSPLRFKKEVIQYGA